MRTIFIHQVPVVQSVNSTTHWINHYPLDNAIDFDSWIVIYPVDNAINALNNVAGYVLSGSNKCTSTFPAQHVN